MQLRLRQCMSVDDADWLALRSALWPDCPQAQHLDEVRSFIAEPGRFAQFIAEDAAGRAVGLAEVSIRSDHVNGTEHSPVPFLEGLYVVPEARRAGVAAALVEAVIGWARAQGYVELASDTQIDNTLSQTVHARLGFEETERVVYYRKPLL
jgi:aminoglycoside 6'-N-acetyltransferase I